jgi:hypothetical protein
MELTFRLSRRSKLGYTGLSLATALLLIVAAIIEPVPVEIALLALVLPLFVILWAIFGVKLTISDQGIHQSFGGLTYKADWQGIAEITNRGLKTADPCLIYNKWNPLVWRM